MSDFLIFDFKRRYKKEWYSLRLPGWQALKERNIIVRGNAVGKQRNTKQPPLRGGAKKIQNILYNTIKDPHRYEVQVSDTTMITIAVSLPGQKRIMNDE